MGFIDKLNTPVAVVVVLVLFLAVDGFLSYRYQQHLQSAGNGATNRPTAVTDPVAAEETSSPGQGVAATAETTTAASAATVGEITAQPAQEEPAAPNVLRVAVRVEGAPLG